MARSIYHLKNWSEYNKSLKKRGSINFWFPKNIDKIWSNKDKVIKKKKGGQLEYTDSAIAICLIIREKYKLGLRETEGFVQSILDLNKTGLKCPDYTIISRRAKNLNVKIPRLEAQESIDIAFDSTGFKVYGEGEWKVRQHGYSKRRTWVKLHIGVNTKTHEIVSEEITSNKVTDDKAFPKMLQRINRSINSIFGDGAYDKKECYIAVKNKEAIPIIPPRKDAVTSKDPNLIVRDFNIEYIQNLGGGDEARKQWKINSGYHKRSISETAMFRLKQLFSDKLKSRTLKTQEVELKTRIAILNKMTFDCIPDSYCVKNE